MTHATEVRIAGQAENGSGVRPPPKKEKLHPAVGGKKVGEGSLWAPGPVKGMRAGGGNADPTYPLLIFWRMSPCMQVFTVSIGADTPPANAPPMRLAAKPVPVMP